MIPRKQRIEAQNRQMKQIKSARRWSQSKKATTIFGTSLLLSTAILPELTHIATASDVDISSNQVTNVQHQGGNQAMTSSESQPNQQLNHPVSNNSTEAIQVEPATQQSTQTDQGTAATTNAQSVQPKTNKATDEQVETVQIPANSAQIKAFIEEIGEDARILASDNDLYASVMIAQAALESGFGTSGLSMSPNYNLFGIKGDYNGASVNMATHEDSGAGKQYGIQANFRRYPSYKESLSDYVHVLKTTNLGNGLYYVGAWKSHTNSYQSATAYLQGRYATSTQYSALLNKLIETYHLTDYDQAPTDQTTQGQYVVKPGDSLWAIAQANHTSVAAIKAANGLNTDLILVGQHLNL
jgi:Muramidase (flagellum-specific)